MRIRRNISAAWTRLPYPLMLCLAIVFLGMFLPAPLVYAKSHIFLDCQTYSPYHLGDISPTGGEQFFEISFGAASANNPGISPWIVDYNGETVDGYMDIALVMETDFVDIANSANTLSASSHLLMANFHGDTGTTQGGYVPVVVDGSHTTPLTNPFGDGSTRACTNVVLRHDQDNPVPMFFQIHLYGDELPGTYRARVYGEGQFYFPTP